MAERDVRVVCGCTLRSPGPGRLAILPCVQHAVVFRPLWDAAVEGRNALAFALRMTSPMHSTLRPILKRAYSALVAVTVDPVATHDDVARRRA